MALVYTPEPANTCNAPTSFDDFLNVLSGLSLGGPSLIVDCDRQQARRNNASLDLTRREFSLLEYLAVRADQVVSRDELVDTVWAHCDLGSDSRTVDIHIRRLRAKLEDAELISTIRGKGYRFNSSANVAVRAVAHHVSRHALAA